MQSVRRSLSAVARLWPFQFRRETSFWIAVLLNCAFWAFWNSDNGRTLRSSAFQQLGLESVGVNTGEVTR